MFEVPHEKKEGGSKLVWIALLVIALVAIVGGAFYLRQQPEETRAATVDLSQADPLNDLAVDRVSMDTDTTGTRAVWTVWILNRSAYTYTDIQYETTYLDAGDRVIATNKGTLPGRLDPHQQRTISDLQDILYPQGTVSYRFRLLEATPTAE